MNNRYSEHLRQAITCAYQSAELYRITYVGTEQVLYGLYMTEDCMASHLLRQAGIDEDRFLEMFKRSINYDCKVHGETPRTKSLFELAARFANTGNGSHNVIGTEHVLYAVFQLDCIATQMVKALAISYAGLVDAVKGVIREVQNLEEEPYDVGFPEGRTGNEKSMNELRQYGTDLTDRASRGMLDPVIGRRSEIEKVVQILTRRTKNNPVLIGEPGVGKSAVVEGLAQAIVSGEVPEILRNKTVFSLDLAGLLAGTKYRGEFEERIKAVMNTISANRDIILFIDEIHLIVGAGASTESPMDAANILKPMLARGELQTIGATTLEEYRKFIEKDAALERRFTPVLVEQPTREDAIVILQGLRDKYEAHHGIVITDEAIEAAVKLSDRYITDRFLPDKAIDLVDEACSRERLRSYTGPSALRELENRLDRLMMEKEKAVKRQNYARAAELNEEIAKCEGDARTLREEWDKTRNSANHSIGVDEIASIVSSWTGIPVLKLTEKESEQLLHLEEALHERIVGQEEAVTAVAQAIRRARAGLKDPDKPIGSFIFVGPTGVGKTDLAKALAESLFGDERLMIRLDMSEFMEKHSVSKLIGAPPGYVGFDDTQGTLAERIRKKPYSVVLFDEIEKAHPDVFNLLLQILDDGRLSDSKGRVVSFKNTVAIMTSNVGAHEVKEVGVLGFRTDEEEGEYEDMKDRIGEALKERFRPEFLNRLDDIIIFHKLSREDAVIICDKMLRGVQKMLSEKRIGIKVSNRARLKLVEEGYSEEYGARPLRRTVRKLVEDRLSEEILLGHIPEGGTVIVDEVDGKLVFSEE